MDRLVGGTCEEERVREMRKDEDRFEEVGVGGGGGDERSRLEDVGSAQI